MKFPSIFILFFLATFTAFSQVGINTVTPHESSMLEISANDKGLLIPRVRLRNTTDVVTIPNPARSLLVYNLTEGAGIQEGFYFWDGLRWQPFSGGGGSSTDAWMIGGNNNINGNRFLGTTNWQTLFFRVNNGQVGRFHPNGGLSLGYEALANDNNGIAIGRNARANVGNEATALGPQTNASGFQSIALGYGASATNNGGAALGHQAVSRAQNGVAIGTSSNTSGLGSVTLGHSARASGEYATAIGYQSEVSSHNSVALGNIARATGQFGMAIGSNTLAEGYESAAMGGNSRASAQRAMAFGYNNRVSGFESAAFGNQNTATAQNATAVGYSNTASGYESLVLGMQSQATGQYATAIGRNVTASVPSSIIIGNSLPVTDYSGSKIGFGTSAPAAGARVDVDDPFKLGKKGNVHKGISSFEATLTIASGQNTSEIPIPSSIAPSSTRATVYATLPNGTNDNLVIMWVKLKDVNTLRVKYDLPGGTLANQTPIYFTIVEF